MKKIIIADDYIVARKGFEHCCHQVEPQAHVLHCPSTKDLYKTLRTEENLCLLILNSYINSIPTMHQLENIRSVCPDLPVLLIGVGNDLVFGGRAIRTGYNGYVNKTAHISELVEAIRKILQNNYAFSQDIMNYSAELFRPNRPIQHPFERLSDREFAVMLCLVNGMETCEIADAMALQNTTISTYKSRVFEKLSIDRTNELKQIAEAYQIALNPPS